MCNMSTQTHKIMEHQITVHIMTPLCSIQRTNTMTPMYVIPQRHRLGLVSNTGIQYLISNNAARKVICQAIM